MFRQVVVHASKSKHKTAILRGNLFCYAQKYPELTSTAKRDICKTSQICTLQ